MGNYEPFQPIVLIDGVGAMLIAALGGPLALAAGLMLLAPSDIPEARPGPKRDLRFFLFALAIPLGVALLQAANSGAPRYHLIAGAAVLMLVAIRAGPRLLSGHFLRWPARLLLALVVAASLITDWRIATNLRADPGKALDAVAAAAPGGSDAATEHPRSLPGAAHGGGGARLSAGAGRGPLPRHALPVHRPRWGPGVSLKSRTLRRALSCRDRGPSDRPLGHALEALRAQLTRD